MALPQKANQQVISQRDYEAANDAKYGKRPVPKLVYSSAAEPGEGKTVVRNVRTEGPRVSTMPGAPKNQAFTSSHPDTATKFNAEYAKKGVQPQSNLDTPSQKYQPVKQINRSEQATRRAEATYYSQPTVTESLKQKISIKKRGAGLAATSLVRARVGAINGGIWSWGLFCWAVFQLPFALLSLVFLMTAGMIDSYSTVTDQDGMFTKLVHYTVKGLVTGVSTISELIKAAIGFDLSVLSPINMFTFTYIILIAFGMIMLLSIYLIYKVNLLRPLSGKGEGFKLGTFLLALAGYSIPILNLLPCFFPWTIAVWRYPK